MDQTGTVSEEKQNLNDRLDKIFEERKNQRIKDRIFWALGDFRYNQRFSNDDRLNTITDIYENIDRIDLDSDGSKKLRTYHFRIRGRPSRGARRAIGQPT
jgi:hypothetical protein